MPETIYYHVKAAGLLPGTRLPKGSYGAYLKSQGMSATNDPQQEHLRETIRQSHFVHLPSRLESSFVFENHEDAILFRDHFRPGLSVYRVCFANPPPVVHRVCFTAWHPDFPNHTVQAHNYWREPPLYGSGTEVFAEEDLIVQP